MFEKFCIAGVLTGLCLCGLARADDDSWKPHPTAYNFAPSFVPHFVATLPAARGLHETIKD